MQRPQNSQYLALAHWNTWTVPKALCYLSLFVIIVSAGAQWSTKLILVCSQALRWQMGLSQRRQECRTSLGEYQQRRHTFTTTAVTDLSEQKYVSVLHSRKLILLASNRSHSTPPVWQDWQLGAPSNTETEAAQRPDGGAYLLAYCSENFRMPSMLLLPGSAAACAAVPR